ncbi:MAG: TerB family tellurite resistance protein, partial [Kiritimatiellae bacterium]|nr:TerB family tellurite resistance protein [Kiritimatiellia bacterium]
AAGAAALPPAFGASNASPSGTTLDFGAFSEALDRLRGLGPADKQSLLRACRAVVEADGKVTDDEREALAAVADAVGAAGWDPAAAEEDGEE